MNTQSDTPEPDAPEAAPSSTPRVRPVERWVAITALLALLLALGAWIAVGTSTEPQPDAAETPPTSAPASASAEPEPAAPDSSPSPSEELITAKQALGAFLETADSTDLVTVPDLAESLETRTPQSIIDELASGEQEDTVTDPDFCKTLYLLPDGVLSLDPDATADHGLDTDRVLLGLEPDLSGETPGLTQTVRVFDSSAAVDEFLEYPESAIPECESFLFDTGEDLPMEPETKVLTTSLVPDLALGYSVSVTEYDTVQVTGIVRRANVISILTLEAEGYDEQDIADELSQLLYSANERLQAL